MKKLLCLVLTCMLVLSAFGTITFASENEIIITTGADFSTLIKANMGATFVIDGEEDTDGDGVNDGIILPANYSSIDSFHGTLKGVDGKNNILITKPGFNSILKDYDAEFENLVLRGSVNITATYHAGALVNQIAFADAVGDATVTFKDITNYADVSCNVKGKYAGGILGAATQRTIEFINCVNYGSISNLYSADTASAGGILGGTSNVSTGVNFTSCYNYGTVYSVTSYTGGISGNAGAVYTFNNCANFGDISNDATQTYSTRGVGGIAGQLSGDSVIENCYNTGNITSTYKAGGIIGQCAGTTGTITNCFNVGTITSTIGLEGANTSLRCGAYGIAGAYNLPVTNCYNLGEVVNENGFKYQIMFPRVDAIRRASVNNYYVGAAIENDVGTQVTLNDLATALPEGFSSEVWTYTEDAEYNYSLPQLASNLFTNDINDDWYLEVSGGDEGGEEGGDEGEDDIITEVSVSTFARIFTSADDPSFVPTTENGATITGGYSIVAARFVLPTGVSDSDVEFGMLVSKRVSGDELTAETCTKEAKASKNAGGAYGILFYGNMVDGDTYYVRPYVKYNGSYTYGAPTSFVFDAE